MYIGFGICGQASADCRLPGHVMVLCSILDVCVCVCVCVCVQKLVLGRF